MRICGIDSVLPVRPPPGGHVNLAADNRLNPRGAGGFIKTDGPVHRPMIGDGHGGLAHGLYAVGHFPDPAGAVQQTEFAMNMQMDKRHSLLLPVLIR